MNWIESITGQVRDVLEGNVQALQHWREQVPAQNHRVKNFENWVLVELVHRLRQSGAQPIKTNGYINDTWRPRYTVAEVQKEMRAEGLRGPKTRVGSLSADVSFVRPPKDEPLNLEIKTQTDIQEVLTDLVIVRTHNRLEPRRDYRAAFIWVVIEPLDEKYARGVRKTVEKIRRRAAKLGADMALRPVGKGGGIIYGVTAPGAGA